MPTKINAEAAPHSWSIKTWPSHVYPSSSDSARYFIRVHKRELFAAGVLTRPGRELVIVGARYVRWLESKVINVLEFDTGAARTRDDLAPRGKARSGAAA
jgi:hypothetical protein